MTLPQEPVADGATTIEGDLGPEVYHQLLGAFLGNLSRQGSELDQAASTGDIPAIRFLAHQIKGTALNFGAVRLDELADRLLRITRDQGELVRTLVDQIDEEVDRLQSAQAPSGRILLVEDDPVAQRVAAAMLEKLGFQVDVVADGAAAVTAATMMRYRTILMDCQLPVLDGEEATRQIRSLQGGSDRTPIIGITPLAMREGRSRCLAAGMDDFLTKPLSLRALVATLERWARGGPDPVVHADSPTFDRPSPTHPALDVGVVERLERLGDAAGEDLMGQLSILFRDDADRRVAALRDALGGDDSAELARSAHTLSGASGNIGANALARLCSRLEATGESGDLRGAGAQLDALEVELDRVTTALATLRPNP